MNPDEDIELGVNPGKINPTEGRLLTLLLTLAKHKNGLSIREIQSQIPDYSSENLDSTRRKLSRDIEELEKMGFSIGLTESNSSKGKSLRYLLRSSEMDTKLKFTPKEVEFLYHLALECYESTIPHALKSAFDKLFLFDTVESPLPSSSDDSSSSRQPSDTMFRILKALKDQRPLRIQYSKGFPENLESYSIDPLKLIRKNAEDFYLVAFDRKESIVKRFIIPKIQSVVEIGEGFQFGRKLDPGEIRVHPLSFSVHPPKTLEIGMISGEDWLLENFLKDYPYKKVGEVIQLQTTNEEAIFPFLSRAGRSIVSVSPSEILLQWKEWVKHWKAIYEKV